MIELVVVRPTDESYAHTARFAQSAYHNKLNADVIPRPDLFASASYKNRIIGCFGLYRAREQEPLLFETYVNDAYRKLAGKEAPREQLAELGTRVVEAPAGFKSFDISLALTAVLVGAGYGAGVRYVGFTTNRMVKRITDALGFELMVLGEPDLSQKDAAFRKNWEEFFRTPQMCAGFHLTTLAGCKRALAQVSQKGIRVGESTCLNETC